MYWLIIFILSVLLVFCIIFYQKKLRNCIKNKNIVQEYTNKLTEQHRSSLKERFYLDRIRMADENIFSYLRCINVPRKPSCRKTPTGEMICRSRLIDCNKLKLILENDPIAVSRIRLFTDQYTQSNKKSNPSEMTYPVKSGWFF